MLAPEQWWLFPCNDSWKLSSMQKLSPQLFSLKCPSDETIILIIINQPALCMTNIQQIMKINTCLKIALMPMTYNSSVWRQRSNNSHEVESSKQTWPSENPRSNIIITPTAPTFECTLAPRQTAWINRATIKCSLFTEEIQNCYMKNIQGQMLVVELCFSAR